ncbi:MAG: Alanine-tRNA ligase [Parcubacteria group bacterium GW2011_GWA1_51_12]|nr:MAG: Alanine-tRNA ligase [Parcubacteria group bacterium GW2011_GWA1_51_12]
MEADKIRNKFLKFFKDRGHAVVSSSSLIPDDPSVLLTTAGMQQFKPYYTGEADPIKDFNSKNTVSIQKSFRTSDIDEVGDETHLTFFEMLGNFSFGGYFKEDAIKWAHEFITKEMGLAISYVSIFRGSDSVPKDEESRAIWQGLGISDIREEGMADVFWGPTGSSGPCGPTTEIYCKDATGQDVEIWNIVFNQFYFPGPREELLSGASGKKLEPLKIPGVDTGMGLERLAMISQGKKNIFETDLFAPLVGFLPKPLGEEKKRIAADHLRGTTFLLADGVRPSNKGAGYILRRLIRRAFAYEHIFKIPSLALDAMAHGIIHQYGEFYPELVRGSQSIMAEITAERSRFSKTLDRGLRELEKMNSVGAVGAFKLYETFGLPYEIIKEVADSRAMNLSREDFDKEFERHQAISRAGVEKKFGGHGLILDTGELKAGSEEELKIVTRLHTATHLLNAALHKVLGDAVEQRGSDITAERTRFDFLFPRKLTREEIKKIEDLVNYAISKDFSVSVGEFPLEEAKKSGALFFYKGHYPARVKVYTVGDADEVFSKELCGGPHILRTGEIGRFKIEKEESSSAGVRRIRATISLE